MFCINYYLATFVVFLTLPSGFPPVEVHFNSSVSPVSTISPSWYPVITGAPGASKNEYNLKVWNRKLTYGYVMPSYIAR